MPKVDPFAFARPMPSTKEFTFVDPRYTDVPITVTLKSPDLVDYNTIQDKAQAFFNEYYDKDFPAVNGRVVEIGMALANTVATIYVLQAMKAEDCYTMEELVAMSINLPTIFGSMSNAISELTTESELGKLTGVRLSPKELPDSVDDTLN